MEPFLDPLSNAPITLPIFISEGETRVVGIKKVGLGPPDGVIIKCTDSNIASCYQVTKLAMPIKAYDNQFDSMQVLKGAVGLEIANTIYFQICGMTAGTTALEAKFWNKPNADPYALSITITVNPVSKKLNLGSDATFDKLWKVHPFNNPEPATDQPGFEFQLCPKFTGNSCMIRFCTTLIRAGVSLIGMPSSNNCGQPGLKHAHHFTFPYDFENWRGLKDAFVWEAKQPYQLQPMPGVAAYWFVGGKQGVILFWNYFPLKVRGIEEKGLTGGHIDLWNKDRMGNDMQGGIPRGNPVNLDSAFFRSRKIVFWPM